MRTASLPLLVAALSAALPAQSSRPASARKLDDGIAAAKDKVAVFVRMADQLLRGAGAYEKFCAEHAGAKRSELRARTIQDLHARADRSFAASKDTVDELVKEEALSDVTRFWIVNGFAA